MAISDELLREAVGIISSITGISIRPEAIVADVVDLAVLFDDVESFKSAIAQTEKELKLLSHQKKNGHPLKDNHDGILSLPYHSVKSPMKHSKADLRIAYDKDSNPPKIRSFGDRWREGSFYKHLNQRKDDEKGWA